MGSVVGDTLDAIGGKPDGPCDVRNKHDYRRCNQSARRFMMGTAWYASHHSYRALRVLGLPVPLAEM